VQKADSIRELNLNFSPVRTIEFQRSSYAMKSVQFVTTSFQIGEVMLVKLFPNLAVSLKTILPISATHNYFSSSLSS
jgi:hypothetical protein